jgi:hypothetical protein
MGAPIPHRNCGQPRRQPRPTVCLLRREFAAQCAPRKDDPYLIGYFIGNEPPWPGRESQFVDLVLDQNPTGLRPN